MRRVKELWERNVAQREMLRVLNEEDGFDIKPRELVRVRARNRWLLRAPNGGGRPMALDPNEQASPDGVSPSRPSPGPGEDAALAARDRQGGPPPRAASEGPQDTGRPKDGVAKVNKRRRRKKKPPAGPAARYPSDTTLDEARRILDLDPATYCSLRASFQRICGEQCMSKETLAGADRWETAKARLVRDMPQLQPASWLLKDSPDPRKVALDVICVDVTERMRGVETKMTLAAAKNLLGVNPEESHRMRLAFHQAVSEAKFTCKSAASPQQWEGLKRIWAERSDLVRSIMDDTRSDPFPDAQDKFRALDAMAKDVMKRIRDSRGRRDQRSSQPPPASPPVSLQGSQPPSSVRVTPSQSSPTPADDDEMDLEDGLVGNALDDMSEVSHASQMAFSPASSSMGGHLPLSLRSDASNLSDSRDALPQPLRAVGSSMPAGMGLESPMEPSLLLEATTNAQAAFMDQLYVQPQYAGPAASTPVYPEIPQVRPAPTVCAAYLRLHPSSSFVASPSLWIATLGSHSVQELRQAAAAKVAGTVCLRVEGVLKDSKGRELSLPIEHDQELGTYLAHLQGAAPTFAAQLVWKTMP